MRFYHLRFLNFLYLFVIVSLLIQCQSKTTNVENLDIQGHRGCRGLMPENTIPGFKKAISLGVQTLELDVVVLKDGTVVVSHEPFFNHEMSTAPDGKVIDKENERSHNMYDMSMKEISRYDVGMKNHPRFPLQKKIPVQKPSLRNMIEEMEKYASRMGGDQIFYNIEIKRTPNKKAIFSPPVEFMVDNVVNILKEQKIGERFALQCFDIETLEYLHSTYPEITLVYLVENLDPFLKNFSKLSFRPDVYSPYFKLITPDLVEHCKRNGIRLITWTVNEPEDILKIINLGVDGIISDFPDRVIELASSLSENNSQ